jgi:hypothetical protein
MIWHLNGNPALTGRQQLLYELENRRCELSACIQRCPRSQKKASNEALWKSVHCDAGTERGSLQTSAD